MSETTAEAAAHPELGAGLVDRRLGVITDVDDLTLHPSLPQVLACASARLTGLPAGAASPGGAVWWSAPRARAAALGEAAERYAAAQSPVVRRASPTQLRADGVAHIDPASVSPHSPAQYATPGFPFAVPDPDQPIAWCRARRLTAPDSPLVDRTDEVLVPASRAGLQVMADEPTCYLPVNAGTAAGPDLAAAGLAALEEACERHAVATSWHGGLRWPRLPTPAWLTAVLGGRRGAYDVAVFAVPDPHGLPVSAVLLTHKDGPVLGMGTALRPRRDDAIAKAAAEAVVSCQAAHQMDDPEVLRSWDGGPLVGWRADRSYRSSYRVDLRDLVDVFCHVQWYLDPTARPALLDRLDSGAAAIGWAPAGDVPHRRAYTTRLHRHGLHAWVVDLTPADLAIAGTAVATCIVPGLRPTTPAAFPPLGGVWSTPLTAPDGQASPLPLPHA